MAITSLDVLDLVQPVLKCPMFGWNNAILNALLAAFADGNRDKFASTGSNIGNYLWFIISDVGFRAKCADCIASELMASEKD